MIDSIINFLNFELANVPGGGAMTVGSLIGVVLVLFAGYFGSRLFVRILGKRLRDTNMSQDVVYTIQRIVFFALLVLIALTALSLLGVPLTAFAFATGAIAIGVGFGAQNIINNFISGWILMAERPIRIGDFIELDNATGTVERIGNRSTRIRRTDGVHLLVPNSQLLERTVTNWTLVDDIVRTTVRVGVAYGSPVRKVAELIRQALDERPDILDEPPKSVIFEDFGDNALIFDAYFWCDVGGERMLRAIRSDLRFRISELFEEHGIVIAFPQRDVHLDSLRPIEVRMVGQESPQ